MGVFIFVTEKQQIEIRRAISELFLVTHGKEKFQFPVSLHEVKCVYLRQALTNITIKLLSISTFVIQ